MSTIEIHVVIDGSGVAVAHYEEVEPGIAPHLLRQLANHMENVDRIANATPEQLAADPVLKAQHDNIMEQRKQNEEQNAPSSRSVN